MWKQVQRVFGPNPKVDVQDELSFHLEMRIRELIERGESPDKGPRAGDAPLWRLR
jgi:hypothetical protein